MLDRAPGDRIDEDKCDLLGHGVLGGNFAWLRYVHGQSAACFASVIAAVALCLY